MDTFLLYVSLFYLTLAISTLSLLAILWSPLAATISALQARKLGRNVWLFGLLGAAYSILLLFPWIHLAMRMANRPAPRNAISVTYAIVFLVLLVLTVFMYIFFDTGPDWLLSREQSKVLVIALGCVGLASAIALVIYVPMRGLIEALSVQTLRDGWWMLGETLYLMPFVLVNIHVAIFVLHFVYEVRSLG